MGHRPAVGARALSDREIREEACHRDELPEGHQSLLHASSPTGDGRPALDETVGAPLSRRRPGPIDPLLVPSTDGPRLSCFVPEDWRDGGRLWQAVSFLKER